MTKLLKNPWDIQSIYELQFFICPSCEFIEFSKQEFVNHAHLSHFEAVDYLKNIVDGSLEDVNCPWNLHITEFKIEENDDEIITKNHENLNNLEIHEPEWQNATNNHFIDNYKETIVKEEGNLDFKHSFDDIVQEDDNEFEEYNGNDSDFEPKPKDRKYTAKKQNKTKQHDETNA